MAVTIDMARRFVDPSEFRLGVGLPPTVPDPGPDLVDGRPRDFGRDKSDAWRRDAADRMARIAALARRFINSDRACADDLDGVVLLRHPEDFARLFAPRVEVVTLFAHSPDGDSVELLATRTSWATLLAAVPRGFSGMLDLRICNAAAGVADHVRVACATAIVRAADGKLDFQVTGWCYVRALAMVARRRTPFDEAARLAWIEHQKPPRRCRCQGG